MSTDPSGWFTVIDTSNNGELSLKEIIEGLKISVNLDWRRIELDSARLFSRWDTDGNGEVSYEEFIENVFPYLQRHYPGAYLAPVSPPDISQHPQTWFEYWDEDGSMSLEKGEIVRALIKTFRLTNGPDLARNIADTLDSIWCIFDTDGSGSIEMDEFLTPDGLCDSILASLSLHRGL